MFRYMTRKELRELDPVEAFVSDVRRSQFNSNVWLVIPEKTPPVEPANLFNRQTRWPWYMIDEVSLIQGLSRFLG